MGKGKQQQRQKRKKPLKAGTHDKSKMKEIMQQLAESKSKNQVLNQKLTSITQLNHRHKNIKKQKKLEKPKVSSSEDEQEPAPKPVVNIFAVESFQAEKPVIACNPKLEQLQRMEDQVDLESKARRVMGENLNLEKFGDKPLKIIEQNNEEVVMSEDEDQPNSLKTITHPNIKLPQGNKSISRKPQIQELRQKLPIFMKEQQIVQTINTHLVTLICGETGSGKSTQLPQFLAEKNYQQLGKIAITQPRRLATVSLARRVAQEMSYRLGSEVAYQVRHERKQSTHSFIKFMTDGILLKEMSSDPLLLDYSVVVIDEAHERKLNTDILIGLLSRLILVRYKMSLEGKCNPLRLVIMSATLRVSDFQNEKLFNFKVPILKVEAKMFPVTVFHERNTPENYIDCAVRKCAKIHKQLPQGDVLVFLTGKQEIHEMSIKLEMALSRLKIEDREANDQAQDQKEEKVQGEYFAQEKSQRKNSTNSNHPHSQDFIIYKLYSSLPSEEQDRVFRPANPGSRKFIISTNIAQTSITVPNIRYVIDSGQEKHRYFDGVWRWSKGWGSKAMAAQRAGRAGRTTHGYCYRLYSSALYANIMDEHPEPEITKLPLESVVLEIKAIGFSNVFAFPFPTPPANSALKKSLDNLLETGALQGEVTINYLRQKPEQMQQQGENKTKVQIIDNCKVTELGKVISFIPLAPRLAKMLLLGRQLKLQKFVVIIAVLLTIESIFKIKYNKVMEADDEIEDNSTALRKKAVEARKAETNQFRQKYRKYIDKQCGSDLFVSMNIVGQFLQQVYNQHRQPQCSQPIERIIASQAGLLDLNTNVMREFYYNCDQICEIYQTLTSSLIDLSQYVRPAPSEYDSILSVLLSSFHTNTCRLEQNNKYINKQQEPVYIHRMSLLYKQKCLFVGCVDFYLNDLNQRKYMRYPFKVTNYEVLASFGRVRQPHEYAWREGCVVGLAVGEIHGWEIPNLVVRDMKGEGKYYAFARMLLSGAVVPGFKVLTDRNWLNSAVSSIRPDNLQEKVQRLVKVFKVHDITSGHKLIECSKANSHFLEKQLKLWLNVKNYEGVFQTLRNAIIKSQNNV